jgi:hypothetical protein
MSGQFWNWTDISEILPTQDLEMFIQYINSAASNSNQLNAPSYERAFSYSKHLPIVAAFPLPKPQQGPSARVTLR